MTQDIKLHPDVLYAFAYRNETPGTYLYHKHTFIEFSTMLEGYSDYNVEGQWRRITAGQVLLFNPGVHHQETQPPHTRSLQLHIGLRQIQLPGLGPDQFPLRDSLIHLGAQHETYFTHARQLVRETQHPEAFGHAQIVASLVELMVIDLLRALPNNQIVQDVPLQGQTTRRDRQALINAAIYYLSAHYQEPVSLAELAQTLHVSASYLSRTFKTIQGESLVNYLTRIRMRRAKQLLDETKLPVHEIAKAVGYADPYYFSKIFKRYFGAAPTLVDHEAK